MKALVGDYFNKLPGLWLEGLITKMLSDRRPFSKSQKSEMVSGCLTVLLYCPRILRSPYQRKLRKLNLVSTKVGATIAVFKMVSLLSIVPGHLIFFLILTVPKTK